ncbi:fimbria/pilus outer membrane usher protein [Citrobacter portucalensis]|nr:fimbria/pilus outer membrane usher protein [Citrobacter portucalensis]WNI88024.1 fimbria/pilus outer membrane usher protein [Citrobacter portucalensis]
MKKNHFKKTSVARLVYNPAALATGMILIGGLYSTGVQARYYNFDASQLGGAGNVDISLLEQGAQLPGTYQVDVILNGERVDSREMVFHLEKDAEGKPFLQTCLTREQLVRYGIKVDNYPGLYPTIKNGNDSGVSRAAKCAQIAAIPQARETFQFNSQQLLLSVPQIALRPRYSGIAPQELWNDGIPAFLMNYQASAFRSEYRGSGTTSSTNSMNVQLEPGLNLGAWRFRNLTTWQKQGAQEGEWQTSYTYAERGLYGLKSRLTLGERFTPSDVFDSVPFRGGMIGSDDAMVPYSQREFAPIVQGTARTQARIEVKQSGYVIYNTTVAPGPFALTDLPVAGDNGDLQVTVFEADGTRQMFSVPYTTPAIALRQGYLKYNVMTGQYRSADSSVDKASVGQATVMYGLPWNLTAYSGGQWANHYQAGALGLGASLGVFGAVSVDGTLSRGQKRDQDMEQGQTWRVRYSKSFQSTNTGFTLASYQYASSGYNSLSEVLDSYRSGDGWYSQESWYPGQGYQSYWYNNNSADKRKSRTSITLNQPLGEWGTLYFSGSRENYWNRSQKQNEVSARYSGPVIQGISWSVDWTQRKWDFYSYRGSGDNKTERSVNLWISVPLNRWLGGNTSVSYQVQNRTDQGTLHNVGLNGYAFDQRLYWDVNQQIGRGGTGSNQNSSDLNLRWNGTYGEVSGGYGYRKNGNQMNAGVQGGVVVHRNGVTAGQRLNNTTALIEAPGASGVSVINTTGVRTDFRGYTTRGNLNPYQENIISLNPVTLPSGVAIPQTDAKVVPTEGAIIQATFVTRAGGRAVITLTQANGKPVPFGAVASIVGQGDTQSGTGIVGDSGDVYMTGLPEKGQLQIQWGNGQQRHCRADYQLLESSETAGVSNLKASCR